MKVYAINDGATRDLLEQIADVDVFDLPQPTGEDMELWLSDHAYTYRQLIVGLAKMPGGTMTPYYRITRKRLRECERLLHFWRGIRDEPKAFAKWWRTHFPDEAKDEQDDKN